MRPFMMSACKCTQEATNDVTGYRHASKLLGITKAKSHSALFGGKFFSLWTNQPVCTLPVIQDTCKEVLFPQKFPDFEISMVNT